MSEMSPEWVGDMDDDDLSNALKHAVANATFHEGCCPKCAAEDAIEEED
jgi:hypothetical protein